MANPDDWSEITRLMQGDPGATIRRRRSRTVFRLDLGLTGASAAATIVASFLSA